MRQLCLFLFLGVYWATPLFALKPIQPIYHGDRNRPHVALTFDDGPNPHYTYRILSMLSTYQVKSTFFVVGQSTKNFPSVIDAIIRDGHELANHTFTHPRLDTLSEDGVSLEISSMQSLLHRISPHTTFYFRPPGGRYNQIVLNVLQRQNISMVLWDVNAGDYHMQKPDALVSPYPYAHNTYQKSAESMVRHIVKKTQNGSIILLHNTDGETIRAIPMIIQQLRQKGFSFVTLNQLLEG